MVMVMVMVMHDKFVLVAGSLLSRVDDLRTANCYDATTSGYVITYVCTSVNKYQVVLVLVLVLVPVLLKFLGRVVS